MAVGARGGGGEGAVPILVTQNARHVAVLDTIGALARRKLARKYPLKKDRT